MAILDQISTESIHILPVRPYEDHENSEFFQSGPGRVISTLVYYLGCPVMMLVAISTNLINVTVFLRAGLNDGMAINFLGLTISDLLYSMFFFTGRTLNAVQSIFGERPYLNTLHLSYILAKYGRMWFNVSVLLTVYAAIQKCACIAIPLTFRNFFTVRKSIITVLCIYLSVATYFLPYLSLDRLLPYTERGTNRTRLGYSLRNRGLAIRIDDFVTYANRIVLPYVSQGIVVVCVITMTVKLRAAAKIRRKMTSPDNDVDVKNATPTKQNRKTESDKVTKTNGNILNSKELRVVRSVNILCGIFIVGTSPQVIIEAMAMTSDSFGDLGRYSALYFFTQGVQQFIEVSSTAVNILVYYHFNSKYRRTFSVLLCQDQKDLSEEAHN